MNRSNPARADGSGAPAAQSSNPIRTIRRRKAGRWSRFSGFSSGGQADLQSRPLERLIVMAKPLAGSSGR